MDAVYLSNGKTGKIVPWDKIVAIEAQGNYTLVQLGAGDAKPSVLLIRRSLKAWKEMLPPDRFAHVHRTRLVNLSLLKAWRRGADNMIILELNGAPTSIAVSRRRWGEIRDQLAERFSA